MTFPFPIIRLPWGVGMVGGVDISGGTGNRWYHSHINQK